LPQSQSRKPGIAVSPSTFKPRIRWTNVRQSRPTSEEADQICRAYFNQFYEAVQARQAVSECAGGGQQKAVEMLDGEIEAFNNLIATYCGT